MRNRLNIGDQGTTGLRESRRFDLGNFIVLMGVTINSVVYSILSILRYISFHAGIFDLGVSSSLMAYTPSGGVSYSLLLSHQMLLYKPIYVLMSPVYNLFPNPEVLVVFQAVWVSLGAFPVYWIARRFLHTQFLSLATALSYLLYFPMTGVLWFDFHYMAIFPTFFLFSMYFYCGQRKQRMERSSAELPARTSR